MDVGAVRLRVADVERQAAFYEQVVGLRVLHRSEELVTLGVETPLIELLPDPSAPPRGRGTTGLFHLAILLPSRPELARALRRIAEARWPLSGASDHLVSEALYLSDAEGNGIEIYRDRPREDWTWRDGQLEMATLPLDLQDVLSEIDAASEPVAAMPAGTRMGHVHLNVADLAESERFYGSLIGLDVTVRGYPGALFMSSGGYHHHIGLNTWTGEGAPPPADGALGLTWFEVAMPAGNMDAFETRLRDAGVLIEERAEGLLIADPARNGVLIRAAA